MGADDVMKAAREAAREALMQGMLARHVNAHEIDAAISAYEAKLAESGLVLVPREPTEAMVEDAREAIYSVGQTSKERAAGVYRAMLAAVGE